LECVNDTCSNSKEIEILPNKVSLRNNNVSNFFYAGRSLEQVGNNYGLVSSEVDTHMIKNNEWGAVAYLTYSLFGRCTTLTDCTDIGINNNGMFIDDDVIIYTGYGASSGSYYKENDYGFPYIVPQQYNTEQGMDASTTGNIYGVYDMSGGTDEYVMGVYIDGSKLWSGYSESHNSGFNGCLGEECTSEKLDGLAFPDSKYYNTYTTESDYLSADLQHAIYETVDWYVDYVDYVNYDNPWYSRGCNFQSYTDAGVFCTIIGNGVAAYDITFRPVLVK